MTAGAQTQIFRIADIRVLHEAGGENNAFPEFRAALRDLATASYYRPLNDSHGPYDVTLSIEEHRLVIRTRNAAQQDLTMHVLALKSYRRLIQDYFLMIESYEKARQNATREKLEAIDMGRRGLHNEGAELLIGRLKDKIEMDMDTARKLFTLICSLHRTQATLSN